MEPVEYGSMGTKASSSLGILIVDDDKTMRALLHSLLLTFGVKNVFEAPDGERGLLLLQSVEPDLVLTDYSMKPVDGVEFVKRVRALPSPLARTPVIMVTGHAERHYVEEARDAGITEFLCKPVTLRDLNARILEVLEHPRPFVQIGRAHV